MWGQLHQCPKCGHTWMCDNNECGGKLNVSDERCISQQGASIDTLSRVRSDGVYSDYGIRKRRSQGGRPVGTVAHR